MRVQKTIGWLLALTPLLALFSCESDDMPDSQQGERVPVTIRLGVEGSGLATRGTTAGIVTDESAINKLDVYIYNESGSEEAHLTEGNFTNNIATTTLTTGTKTIRAVANAGTNPTSPIDAVSLITAESSYIPMSTTADTTWSVTNTENAQYEVRLNRMVAKMEVSIVDERANQDNNVTSLSISDLLPSSTNLYRSGYGIVEMPSDATYSDWSCTNNFTSIPAFYLHETSEKTFNITLQINNETNTRIGSFTRTIPRNHILPLNIYLTDYSLKISGTYELAPIGVNPFKADITPNGYTVNLPEGCSNVAMSIKLKDNSSQNEPTGVTWTYTKDGALEEDFDISTDNTEGSLSITSDKLTALPTGSVSLHLTAHYDNKDIEFNVVTINVRALDDEEWNNTRSASPEAQPIIIEL